MHILRVAHLIKRRSLECGPPSLEMSDWSRQKTISAAAPGSQLTQATNRDRCSCQAYVYPFTGRRHCCHCTFFSSDITYLTLVVYFYFSFCGMLACFDSPCKRWTKRAPRGPERHRRRFFGLRAAKPHLWGRLEDGAEVEERWQAVLVPPQTCPYLLPPDCASELSRYLQTPSPISRRGEPLLLS